MKSVLGVYFCKNLVGKISAVNLLPWHWLFDFMQWVPLLKMNPDSDWLWFVFALMSIGRQRCEGVKVWCSGAHLLLSCESTKTCLCLLRQNRQRNFRIAPTRGKEYKKKRAKEENQTVLWIELFTSEGSKERSSRMFIELDCIRIDWEFPVALFLISIRTNNCWLSVYLLIHYVWPDWIIYFIDMYAEN
jgi:hypothetical protein